MILRRLGNKSKLADEIQKHFPPHRIYIEPFFGAGGMFFNKPKVQYNIVNDLDSDVFNLFQVVSNDYNELERLLKLMPIHTDLLEYWKENKEVDPIRKALRFLFLSNLTWMNTIVFGASRCNGNQLLTINELLQPTQKAIFGVQFMNKDFRVFFNSISLDDRGDKGETAQTFIYCDPPYLDTNDNYSHSFTKHDASDLFDCLIKSKCKFAYSEFDHPFILEQAKTRKLYVEYIGERQNLKNRRMEILVTNYKTAQISLFDYSKAV